MTKKMLIMKAVPLLSAISTRQGIAAEEKEQILDSIEQDPENSAAKTILARLILQNPQYADIKMLYELLKET